MSRPLALLLTLVLLAAPAASASDRADHGPLAQRVERIARQLRCPVCQDLSVWDSPSPVAQAIRLRIRTLARSGQSDAQIRSYFVARYGDWILLSPPKHGIALAVWLAPLLLLLTGGALAATTISRWRRRARMLASVDPTLLAAGRRQLDDLERSQQT